MYAVLILVLLMQAPKKEDPKDTSAALRERVIKEYNLEPKATESPLRKLQRERCIALALAITMDRELLDISSWYSTRLAESVELFDRLYDKLVVVMDNPADKVKCYEICLAKLKELEAALALRIEFGTHPLHELHIAKAARIDAEIELLKLKESLKSGK